MLYEGISQDFEEYAKTKWGTFFLWEGITKKPLSDKIMGYIQYAGFIFIMALSALVLLNDVIKLWF